MDRQGVRRGPERTPSGAAKAGGESAAYDAKIQANMDERVKEAEVGVKSKARRRALGRMS